MNKDCEVVRDLIPLYTDGLASEGSKELIKEHCKNCIECRNELENASQITNNKEIIKSRDKVWADIAVKKKKNDRKIIFLIISIFVLYSGLIIGCFILFIAALDNAFPNLTPNESFSDVNEYFHQYSNNVIKANDIDYDVWPPYRIIYKYEIGNKIIVLHTCQYSPGDDEELVFTSFEKESDGRIKYDSFDWVYKDINSPNNPLFSGHFSVDTKTEDGEKVADFYYLPFDSDADIYVGDIKAEKIEIDDQIDHFYLCVIVRDKKSDPEELFGMVFGTTKGKKTEN